MRISPSFFHKCLTQSNNHKLKLILTEPPPLTPLCEVATIKFFLDHPLHKSYSHIQLTPPLSPLRILHPQLPLLINMRLNSSNRTSCSFKSPQTPPLYFARYTLKTSFVWSCTAARSFTYFIFKIISDNVNRMMKVNDAAFYLVNNS